MPDLKEIHSRIKGNKREKRGIQATIKNALENDQQLQHVVEQIKELTAKKKDIEARIKEDFAKDILQIENLTSDIEADGQLLTDMSLTQYAKGETVEIIEDNGLKWEPKFKVSFTKA